ncbi:hypothetical protein H4Q26_002404 [Puccinia striiformis f. sp. tritici PST-130]|nr:hypothetical protein H4Q26_002404 [Puccinia striiformis f. sp. tritici PST-130]
MFSKTRKFPLATSNGTHRAGPSGHCASKLGIATISSTSTTTGLVGSLGFVSEIAGTKGFRKWSGTVVAIICNCWIGVYLIMDIPRAIPRNIGKKLERELNSMINTKSTPNAVQESGEEEAGIRWIDYEIERMSKETRKVVRLTGFELREKFRNTFESISNQTDQFKVDLEHAIDVQNWLTQYEHDVNQVLGDCTSSYALFCYFLRG